MRKNSIIKKLKNSFNIISVAVVLIAFMAICSLAITVSQFSVFYHTYNVSNVAKEAMLGGQIVAKSMVSALSVDDEVEMQKYLDLYVDTLAEMQANVDYMKKNYTGDVTPIDKYAEVMLGAVDTRKEIMELTSAGKKDEASKLYFSEYNSVLNKAIGYLSELADSADKIANNAYNKARIFAWCFSTILFLLCLVIVCLTFFTSNRLIKMFKQPIDELERGMQELASGELNFKITYKSDDELGILASNFEKICNFLKIVINDTNRLLKGMGEGNFDVQTDYEDMYIGEFESLIKSMHILNHTLSGVFAGINDISEKVALGSTQLAESAHSVAIGATEQTSAVEELQAITKNVLENTHHASKISEDSYQKAKNYTDNAKMAEKEMSYMMNVINEINDLSVKVGSIVENIEDIASQTNLLSLNASIEAARAGEAGKGFAVVAQQIGILADDSAKSALNTRELIENTIEKIHKSNVAANTVANALTQLIEGITNLSELFNNSKEVSVEQEKSMSQIEEEVTNISEIVQSNSKASQEMFVSSQESSTYAVHLKEMLEQFQFHT